MGEWLATKLQGPSGMRSKGIGVLGGSAVWTQPCTSWNRLQQCSHLEGSTRQLLCLQGCPHLAEHASVALARCLKPVAQQMVVILEWGWMRSTVILE